MKKQLLSGLVAAALLGSAALPAVAQNIGVVNGKPVPYCLARIPLAGETRGNLAAGGRGVAQPLSDHDWHIANEIAPKIAVTILNTVTIFTSLQPHISKW